MIIAGRWRGAAASSLLLDGDYGVLPQHRPCDVRSGGEIAMWREWNKSTRLPETRSTTSLTGAHSGSCATRT